MAEQVKIKNMKLEKTDLEKGEKIIQSINNIKNKKSKFLFTIPDISTHNVSIYEIYLHAHLIKKMGYTVYILTENENYKKPTWIDLEFFEGLNFVPMSNSKINVGPEDVLIIPEVFSNVMEQTKNLPCLRIGLLQSVDYMLNSLIPGMQWKHFGINHIITTSKTLKDFIDSFFGKNMYKIQYYNLGIPEYFEKTEDKPKKPIISIMGRNQNEITKIVKLFYLRYPQFGWVTFDSMLTNSKPPKQLSRKDFAERLKENMIAVWIDRISSFGTFPLEAMKAGTIPIALIPDILPEYIVERDEKNNLKKINPDAGIWTSDYYQIPILLGETLSKLLDSDMPDYIYENMKKIAKSFTQKESKKEIVNIYKNLINERILFLEKSVEGLKNNKEE